MIKKIVLVRHGETTPDKNNPTRGLAKAGRKQIEETANKLTKCFKNQGVIIIANNTVRTKISAEIIARKTNQRMVVSKLNLRIKNIEKLKTGQKKSNLDLTSKYWQLFKKNKLPSGVEKPAEVAMKFFKLIAKYQRWAIIVIVGHAGALETFAKFQNQYKSKNKIDEELNYGQYIILDRKRSKLYD